MRGFLKFCLNRTVIAFFCLFAIFLLFSGCGGSTDRASWFDAPFIADAEGLIGERRASVTVFCDPVEREGVYNKLTVTFSSPEGLRGMTVSLFSDGYTTARLGELEGGSSFLSKAAAPYLVFCPEGEYLSVRVTEEGSRFAYGEGEDRVSYLFGSNGELKSIDGSFGGENISLKITNFRKIGE